MRPILLIMLLFLLFAGWTANAAENELKLGITTATRYNDNVGNHASGKDDAFVFDIGPTLIFDSSASKFEGGASYSPRFATYFGDSRDDDISHNFGLNGAYRPNRRWTFSVRDVLGLRQDDAREFEDEDGTDITNGGQQQTLQNRFNGTVKYSFNPRITAITGVSHSLTGRQDTNLSDSNQIAGRTQLNYGISPQLTLGGGANVRRQNVEEGRELTVGANSTNYYGIFGYLEHRFTPLFGISGSGGPTWLVSDQEGDGRKPKKSLDYFAAVEATAEVAGGSAKLSYTRSSSDFASSATSFIIDAISFEANWAMSQTLAFHAAAEWNERTSVLRFEDFDLDFVNKVRQWKAAATASYRINSNLSSQFTVDYLRQNAEGDGIGASDRFRVVVRFNYNAQALRF